MLHLCQAFFNCLTITFFSCSYTISFRTWKHLYPIMFVLACPMSVASKSAAVYFVGDFYSALRFQNEDKTEKAPRSQTIFNVCFFLVSECITIVHQSVARYRHDLSSIFPKMSIYDYFF